MIPLLFAAVFSGLPIGEHLVELTVVTRRVDAKTGRLTTNSTETSVALADGAPMTIDGSAFKVQFYVTQLASGARRLEADVRAKDGTSLAHPMLLLNGPTSFVQGEVNGKPAFELHATVLAHPRS